MRKRERKKGLKISDFVLVLVIFKRVCACVRACVRARARARVCVCARACMCVCMCVFVPAHARLSQSTVFLLQSNLSVYKQVLSGVEEFRKTDPTVLSGDMAHHIHKVVTEK